MAKRQMYLWTAAVGAACIALSLVLQRLGLVPDWAGTAVAVLPIVFVMGELDRWRKRGQEYSLSATLAALLKAAVVTAVAVSLMLLVLSAEGFLFECAGVLAAALIAMAVAHLLGWFPGTGRAAWLR